MLLINTGTLGTRLVCVTLLSNFVFAAENLHRDHAALIRQRPDTRQCRDTAVTPQTTHTTSTPPLPLPPPLRAWPPPPTPPSLRTREFLNGGGNGNCWLRFV